MFRNEILGLACLGDRIESCLLIKQGKRADGPSWGADQLRSQTLEVHEHREEAEVLRQILSPLAPSRRRAICLGIGRRHYLMREIPCPGCTIEEAIASIRLSLDYYLPLPCDDVYCDLLAKQCNGVANVQLYWVERRYVDALVAALQTTGHIRSLVTVAPLCCGLDLYLRSCGQEHLPGSLVSMQTQLPVVTFHATTEFAGSLPLRLDSQQRPKLDLPSLGMKMAETIALPLRILGMGGGTLICRLHFSNPWKRPFLIRPLCPVAFSMLRIGVNVRRCWPFRAPRCRIFILASEGCGERLAANCF